MNKKLLLLVYLLALTAFVLEVCRVISYLLPSETFSELSLIESILISIGAIIIRIFIVDSQKFSAVILETDIQRSTEGSPEKTLKPTRFLNIMPLAMITCSIADGVISINFILGMLTFLLAQLLYMVAYSGIIHLNLKTLFSGKIKSLVLISTISWAISIIILYVTLIYSADNILTLVVIPYIVVITIMALITFYGLGYTDRSLKFRIILCIGATLFVISDAILAINMFKFPIPLDTIWIIGTYLPAIFLLQFAVLFLQSQDANSK